MSKLIRTLAVAVVGVFCCSIGAAEAQEAQAPAGFSRRACIKAREGKGPEAAAYFRDVAPKLGQASVNSGVVTSWVLLAAAVPTGRAAVCDYIVIQSYSGYPPEAFNEAQMAAALKQAGLSMTPAELSARRADALDLVSGSNIWRTVHSAGQWRVAKGSYIETTNDKARPGMAQAVLDLEAQWKAMAEVRAKENGTSWRASTLVRPTGAEVPFNIMTENHWPSWEMAAKGIPTRPIWNRVHPNIDQAAVNAQLLTVRDRLRTVWYRVNESFQK